jgi:hypothetical protein
VNLSPAQSGGTWSGTGITNPSTGTFNPSVAGAGTFVITYSISCGMDSIYIVVKNCTAPTACLNANGDLTAQGGAGPTYVWQSQTTTTNCATCLIPASCFPPGCAVTQTVWTTYSNNTTATPPSYPVKLIDTSGNTVIISFGASAMLHFFNDYYHFANKSCL